MQATISIVGNVGNVRVFDNENGGKTVYFSVAVNQRQPKNGGETTNKPMWYNFRAINGIGNALAQYLEKGRLVSVVGVSPRIREYEVERTIKLNNGDIVRFIDKQTSVDYLVADLRFIGGSRNSNGNSQQQEIVGEIVSTGGIVGEKSTPTVTDPKAPEVPVLDDVPF